MWRKFAAKNFFMSTKLLINAHDIYTIGNNKNKL